jgi:hypothetical protein
MLDEVNNEDSNDFDDDKNAPEVTDEQHALLASFESACRDPAGQHLMATKRQALSKEEGHGAAHYLRDSPQGQPGDGGGVGHRRGR